MDCEVYPPMGAAILFRPLFGLDNWEHLRLRSDETDTGRKER